MEMLKSHLIDCTYCTHRNSIKNKGKGKTKAEEIETCALTGQRIPPPTAPHRWCEQFHQEGHTCKNCFIGL